MSRALILELLLVLAQALATAQQPADSPSDTLRFDKGTLATIGRNAAVAQIGRQRLATADDQPERADPIQAWLVKERAQHRRTADWNP